MDTVPFELKVENRFVVKSSQFPSHLIYKADRPSFTTSHMQEYKSSHLFSMKKYIKWNNIIIQMYDPIVPSMAQVIMEVVEDDDFKLKDFTIDVIGSNGDIVEQWSIESPEIVSADFGQLNWKSVRANASSENVNKSEPCMITLEISIGKARLLF